MQTHYQHLEEKIQIKKKERKSLNQKITRLLNDDSTHPGISALSKQSHLTLVDILLLKDEKKQLEL